MGLIIHSVAAIVIVLAILKIYWLAIPALFVLGFFWEKTQHRYTWSIQDGNLHREKNGWFGWITKHRLLEAAGWPIGALVASIIWFFISV